MVLLDERPRCHHGCGGHHSCRAPAAFSRYGGRDTTRCRSRGHAGSSVRAPLQPFGPDASSSTMEQWRHDVDQLVVAAINTPPHGGRRANHSEGCQRHRQSAHRRHHVHRQQVLPQSTWGPNSKRRRSGEDDRITIERRRERRRNLNGDFGAANATLGGQAALTPTSPGSGGGCMALAPQLRMVV
jgi:hypothetical protein